MTLHAGCVLFILRDWPVTPEQQVPAAAGGTNTRVRSVAGGCRLCRAADGWWRCSRATLSVRCQRAEATDARKGSFPPGYTAAGCLSPRSTGEARDWRHLLFYHRQVSWLCARQLCVPERSSELWSPRRSLRARDTFICVSFKGKSCHRTYHCSSAAYKNLIQNIILVSWDGAPKMWP